VAYEEAYNRARIVVVVIDLPLEDEALRPKMPESGGPSAGHFSFFIVKNRFWSNSERFLG
jgi:hypothetical protein